MKNRILQFFKGKSIAFLENSPYLDDIGENLSKFLKKHNIPHQVINNIEIQGLESVLRQCKDFEVIVFHTTWTYPVSRELKNAFMSIQNRDYKKSFVELFSFEPTFQTKPKVIHDMYNLNCFSESVNNWIFYEITTDTTIHFKDL